MIRVLGMTLGLLIAASIAYADDPAPEEKTGLKIGDKAPEFKLLDQNGEERSLSQMLKEGNVAVVFYRSASW